MAQISTPDKGQPIDISFLSNMVTEINNISTALGSQASLSKLKYRDASAASDLLTSKLAFYAESKKVVDGNLSTQTNTQVTFDYSNIFKTTPIVLCSVASESGVSNLYGVLKGITQNNCEVNIFSTATAGAFSADVSIIVIGERIQS
jgi:hypothetical protein